MLFERKSITDFVSIVAKLATDFSSRERIGKESQRYVLAERTWISNVEKVLSSFEKRYPSQTI
jgi:hypothetical protein